MRKDGTLNAIIRRKGEENTLEYAVTLDGEFIASGTVVTDDIDDSLQSVFQVLKNVFESVKDRVKEQRIEIDIRKESER